MSQSAFRRPTVRQLLSGLVTLVLIVAAGSVLLAPAHAAQLGNRQLRLVSSKAGDNTTYILSFRLVTPGTLGSIKIQFCSNDPFVADPCTAPSGMDMTNSQPFVESGVTGFSTYTAGTNANQIVLTRTAAPVAAVAVSYSLGQVVNPANGGSYYARIQTFATTDASGTASDYGGIAFAINNILSVSAEVPPYLIFCTGTSITGLNCANAVGDQIDFGEFSSLHSSVGSSQMLAATNALDGYNITMVGTTLTSGNNVIDAIAPVDVSRPGTAQFGLNLRANTSPAGGIDPSGTGVASPTINYNQPNFYRFASNDVVASSTGPDNFRQYTSDYIVNVPKTQAPGVYVSTLTYICLATF